MTSELITFNHLRKQLELVTESQLGEVQMKLPIVRIQGKKNVYQLLMEIPFTKPQKKFLIGIKYLGSVLIKIRLLLLLLIHNC